MSSSETAVEIYKTLLSTAQCKSAGGRTTGLIIFVLEHGYLLPLVEGILPADAPGWYVVRPGTNWEDYRREIGAAGKPEDEAATGHILRQCPFERSLLLWDAKIGGDGVERLVCHRWEDAVRPPNWSSVAGWSTVPVAGWPDDIKTFGLSRNRLEGIWSADAHAELLGAALFYWVPAQAPCGCHFERKMPFVTSAISEALERYRRERVRESHQRDLLNSPLVLKTPAMEQLTEQIEKWAHLDEPVLLCGEPGVGKTALARVVHRLSSKTGEFVPVNVAVHSTGSSTTLRSEFFGYVKGAFTDAREDRDGLFDLAKGGTIFIDEIGELPLELQLALLEVLGEGTYRPVGVKNQASAPKRLDARIILATNHNLEDDVAAGRFRGDLYSRIEAFTIHIPPLRARPGDILPLATEFLRSYKGRRPRPPTLDQSAKAALQGHHWRYNVRGLENHLKKVLANHPHTTVISASHLQPLPRFDLPAARLDQPLIQVSASAQAHTARCEVCMSLLDNGACSSCSTGKRVEWLLQRVLDHGVHPQVVWDAYFLTASLRFSRPNDVVVALRLKSREDGLRAWRSSEAASKKSVAELIDQKLGEGLERTDQTSHRQEGREGGGIGRLKPRTKKSERPGAKRNSGASADDPALTASGEDPPPCPNCRQPLGADRVCPACGPISS